MVHIPSRMPRLNSIETEWREIRAAITGILFGGLDKMRDAIIRMFRNGEMSMVKLPDWLLPLSLVDPAALQSTRAAAHTCRITAPQHPCATHPEEAHRRGVRREGATGGTRIVQAAGVIANFMAITTPDAPHLPAAGRAAWQARRW